MSTHGCCLVYQRPRLMSKRQIVPLCHLASALRPTLFICLVPWLQLEMPDVCGFSTRWQTPLWLMTHAPRHMGIRAWKPTEATLAKRGLCVTLWSAFQWEIIDSRRGGKRSAWNLSYCFLTPCANRENNGSWFKTSLIFFSLRGFGC